MTELGDIQAAPAASETVLHLTPAEVELVRSALRMLRNVLGREEADELAVVQAVLERLEAPTQG